MECHAGQAEPAAFKRGSAARQAEAQVVEADFGPAHTGQAPVAEQDQKPLSTPLAAPAPVDLELEEHEEAAGDVQCKRLVALEGALTPGLGDATVVEQSVSECDRLLPSLPSMPVPGAVPLNGVCASLTDSLQETLRGLVSSEAAQVGQETDVCDVPEEDEGTGVQSGSWCRSATEAGGQTASEPGEQGSACGTNLVSEEAATAEGGVNSTTCGHIVESDSMSVCFEHITVRNSGDSDQSDVCRVETVGSVVADDTVVHAVAVSVEIVARDDGTLTGAVQTMEATAGSAESSPAAEAKGGSVETCQPPTDNSETSEAATEAPVDVEEIIFESVYSAVDSSKNIAEALDSHGQCRERSADSAEQSMNISVKASNSPDDPMENALKVYNSLVDTVEEFIDYSVDPLESAPEASDSSAKKAEEAFDCSTKHLESGVEASDSPIEPEEVVAKATNYPEEPLENALEVSNSSMESEEEAVDHSVEPLEDTVEAANLPKEHVEVAAKASFYPEEPLGNTLEASNSPTEREEEAVDSIVKPSESAIEAADSLLEPSENALEPFNSPVELLKSTLEAADSPEDPSQHSVEATEVDLEPLDGTSEDSENPVDTGECVLAVTSPVEAVGTPVESEDEGVESVSGSDSTSGRHCRSPGLEKSASCPLIDDLEGGAALRRRRVSFPEGGVPLVTGYIEPRNPLTAMYDTSPEALVQAYRQSCQKHRCPPLPAVLRQVSALPLRGGRVDSFSLRGLRLERAQCESLEEVLKKVQFSSFDVSNCGLDDDSAAALFEMIEFYDSALSVNIGGNRLGVRGWQAACRMIKASTSLERLAAAGIELCDQSAAALGRALRLSHSLRVLHLEGCRLHGRPIALLTAGLRQSSVLRELYLADNQLGTGDGSMLGNMLKSNLRLDLMDVRTNHFDNDSVAFLLEGLAQQTPVSKGDGLVSLNLWCNLFTSKAASSVDTLLTRHSTLETLNLGSNMIGDDMVVTLQTCLSANVSIRRLGLQQCRLSCQAALVLAETLDTNQTLQRLDLRGNRLGPSGLLALASTLERNSSLLQLDLTPAGDDHEQQQLHRRIRELCEANRQRQSEEQPSRKASAGWRRVSLTCDAPAAEAEPACAPESPTPVEQRRRLVSPSPSPSCSPLPRGCRSRFRVFRVNTQPPGSPATRSHSESGPSGGSAGFQ